MFISSNKSGNVSPAAITVIVLLLFVILGGAYMLFFKPNDRMIIPDENGQLSDEQVELLVEKVGELMVLPNETPLVATVEDAGQLRAEQAFYKDVQNGDKLIIFPQAAKAIIYREEENKVVNAGPIFVNNNEDTVDAGLQQ